MTRTEVLRDATACVRELRAWMKAKNVSVIETAKRLDVTRASVYLWLGDECLPGPSIRPKIRRLIAG